jgi:hypothetical protein
MKDEPDHDETYDAAVDSLISLALSWSKAGGLPAIRETITQLRKARAARDPAKGKAVPK